MTEKFAMAQRALIEKEQKIAHLEQAIRAGHEGEG